MITTPPLPQTVKEIIGRLNLVVISPVGRSGSMLLQSLLDGHPEVVVFPEVAQEYNYIDVFKDNKCNISAWLDAHPTFYNGFDSKNSTFQDELNGFFNQNRTRFEETFRSISSALGGAELLVGRTFMASLALSWAVINEQTIENIKLIVFHLHNNRRLTTDMPTILADFPFTKLLVGGRHPIENALSFKTLDKRTGIDSFRNYSRNLRGWSVKSWRNLQKAILKLPSDSNFKLLDLNALHNDPETLINKLSNWLEIKNDQSLYQPTICGIPWLGNSADGTPIPAFDKKRAQLLYPISIDTEQGLTANEYRFAEYFTRDILTKAGYSDSVNITKVNIFGFLSVGVRKIEFFQKNVIPIDKGIKSLLRKFGYSELLLVILEVIHVKLFPFKSMQHYRFDITEDATNE